MSNDKESVVLKYLQIQTNEIEENLKQLHHSNNDQLNALDDIQNQLDSIYKLLGKNPKKSNIVIDTKTSKLDAPKNHYTDNFEDVYNKAEKELIKRGLDVENIDYHDLVTEAELEEIIAELNRPLSTREKWTKNDFIVVFIAASLGSLVDIILSKRDNKFTGADPRKHYESEFSSWLNQYHDHPGGSPIDYQGPNFGGGFHRELSKGHDILRFVEAIWMFKNGQFEAIKYVDGNPIKVITTVNQYGNPYEQLSIIEAICRYVQHMLGDLFSTCSLPFPGYSFLRESSNRELRVFSSVMYQNGFNLKNIMIQSMSAIIIEIIIRVYFSLNTLKNMNDNLMINEDYSNWDKIRNVINPQNQVKLNELLLVAHAIVAAINIGKIVIKKSPWEINVAEIIAVIRYGIKVIKSYRKRNDSFEKLIRNANEIHDNWLKIEQEIGNIENEALLSIDETLII